MIEIIQSDAVKWANEYSGPLFHALLTDAPYHLTTITKRFGKDGSAPAKFGTDGVFQRASTGFMGQDWDGGDVAFRPETWAAFMRVLCPGAFGMCFASSRGWHRLAVAIEDAGFIIHPTIFGWLYGSGFPKSTRIDTQIDRAAGVEREKVPNPLALKQTGQIGTVALSGDRKDYKEIELPATDLAKAWEGHRYGLQALKPALEPIIVFQKPYEGKPIECMIQTGAGALNIEAARIPGAVPQTIQGASKNIYGGGKGFAPDGYQESNPSDAGRWPANFILGDEEAAEALDKQAGHLKSGYMGPEHQRVESAGEYQSPHGIYGKFNGDGIPLMETYADEGGASRFFFNVQEQIDEADPVYYCSKVSKAERDSGIKGKCKHPTLKPLRLDRYLATLLRPPEMYAPRRLFVPFAGVGSECIGADQALWEEIVGVELKEDYCEVARLRVEYWAKKGVQLELFP